MDEQRSVHDNLLLSYTVLAREREIRLHTAFLEAEPHEYTDVVFSDVVAYHFEHDNFRTVLFDVTEESLEEVYDEREDLFRKGCRYTWPVEHGSGEELLKRLREEGTRAFGISSSLGLSGWVWAREATRVAVDRT